MRLSHPEDSGPATILEMSVADTGTGIHPNIRDQIFEPFFTTKEPGKGTGLGLSIVRDIVKDHNGRLEVISKLGEGTTFTVRLPSEPRVRDAKSRQPSKP